MNKLQKIAWFNLIALGIILLFSVVLTVVAGGGNVDHFSGLGSLWLLATLVVMVATEWWAKRQRPGRVEFDERDRIIQIKALQFGMLALLGVFLWMWWLIVPSDGAVSTWIPILLGSAALAGALVYSIWILAQYGRGGKNVEK
jgi:uncharacterized membrane protein